MFFSRDVGQNAINQSDCKIFKSTISPEQNSLDFAFRLQIHKNQKLIGNFWAKHGQKMGKANLVSVP